MTELEQARAQIESLVGQLIRIMDVCDRLQQALTHPTTPELTKAALAAYRALPTHDPESQPPPQRTRT